MTIELDDHRRREFDGRGFTVIEGLVDTQTVEIIRTRLYSVLQRLGLRRESNWTLESERTVSLQTMQEQVECSELAGLFEAADPRRVIEQLLDGRAVRSMTPVPQLLFTPPNAKKWFVPYRFWHVDVPRLSSLGTPGVQVFSFLDPVDPGGGGTAVVAGSHLLLNDRGRMASNRVTDQLREHPWFASLLDPTHPQREYFLDERNCADDVKLQVIELHGKPGDVYFVDIRILHAPAPNASSKPRAMVTQRFLLQSLYDAAMDDSD